MKKLKNQNGAVTLLVLISLLFFITFLASTYIIVSNKAESQIEIRQQIKKGYELQNEQDVYNSYFGDQIVPIYTVEELLQMGTDKQISIDEEKGKIYTFSKSVTYILMNNLKFDSDDWQELLREDEEDKDWIPIGYQIANEPSWSDTNFEGNSHTITVTNLDNSVSVYSESNNYSY